MFTVCPKCALTLVVTAADLRVAQGYVRCGRCSSVFNALARLAEERRHAARGEPTAAVRRLSRGRDGSWQSPRATALPAAAACQPRQRRPRATRNAASRGSRIAEDSLEFDPARPM